MTQEVCRARFQLSDREKEGLSRIASREKLPDIIEVSRNYAGALEVNFGEGILTDEFDSDIVNVAFETVPNVEIDFSDHFKEVAEACLEELRELAEKGQLAALRELTQKHELLLEERAIAFGSSTAN